MVKINLTNAMQSFTVKEWSRLVITAGNKEGGEELAESIMSDARKALKSYEEIAAGSYYITAYNYAHGHWAVDIMRLEEYICLAINVHTSILGDSGHKKRLELRISEYFWYGRLIQKFERELGCGASLLTESESKRMKEVEKGIREFLAHCETLEAKFSIYKLNIKDPLEENEEEGLNFMMRNVIETANTLNGKSAEAYWKTHAKEMPISYTSYS